ncbi:MAG: hypothetical protein NWF09_05790 [Candidatus Bathyarchaeota archaeon]|nr:hypothetical protein [Candidatus Bathyarchaeota archaeon]
MPKKSMWDSRLWKIVLAIGTILGIIVSLLTIFDALGKVAFWATLNNFLTSSVSVYVVLVLLPVIVILIYSVGRIRKRESCILDFEDARHIAILCQTPRTTDFLRQQYDYWQRQSRVVVLGGYGFDDYMKRLEKQDFLKYQNGTWQVTQKALDYIAKYHGG